jgi:hypothetical protein
MKPLPSRASRKPASSPHLLPGRLRRRSTRVLPSRNTKGDKPARAKQAGAQASAASTALAFFVQGDRGDAFLSQARR